MNRVEIITQKRENMKKYVKLIALLLTIAMLVTSCGARDISFSENETNNKVEYSEPDDQYDNYTWSKVDNEDFNAYLQELFEEIITANTINMHYTFENPDQYGVESYENTIGKIPLDGMETNKAETQEIKDKLMTFDYSSLSQEQQIIYDILESDCETSMEGYDNYLLDAMFSPYQGIQTQIPAALENYYLLDKKDVDDYIELLDKLADYVDDAIAYEQQRVDAGYIMNTSAIEFVINYCEDFIENPDSIYLNSSFETNLKEVTGLTNTQIEEYKTANKETIKTQLIPAYKRIITFLEGIKESSSEQGGLCSYENGQERYQYLIDSVVGTSKTAKQLMDDIDTFIKDATIEISEIVANDVSLYSKLTDFSYEITEPEAILEDLIEKMKNDFPTPSTTNYVIKSVDPSIAENTNPAYYMLCPYDDITRNIITVNEADESYQLYNLLGHEGYPGHLYQTTYFYSLQPNPIRTLMFYGGYLEGWGTYAENYAYHLYGLEDDFARLCELNSLLNLAIYAKCDIGVNSEGWKQSDITKLLKSYGVTDTSSITDIYELVANDPAMYIQYFCGYLEIMELKELAYQEWGDTYTVKRFHEFYLTIGPAPFEVIQKWIKITSKMESFK